MFRKYLGYLLGSLWLLGVSAPGFCQTKPLVELSCRIDSVPLKAFWSKNTGAIASGLCARLSDYLNSDSLLSFWWFATNSVGAQSEIRFLVIDGIMEDENRLEVSVIARGEELISREVIWRKPGDTVAFGDPLPRDAVDVLYKEFVEILKSGRLDFFGKLRGNVPIAIGGQLMLPTNSGNPRVIAWLPWERYKKLRDSEFEVVCSCPRCVKRAFIFSIAYGIPYRYQLSGAKESGDVLVLSAKRIRYGEEPEDRDFSRVTPVEAKGLSPQFIYIKRFKESEFDVY